MHDTCLYHPSRQGEWTCQLCEGSFCEECAVWKDTGWERGKKSRAFCPSCNRRLQWIGAANLLPPFWERLHRFFLYPFHRQALILLLLVSAASVLLGFVPILGALGQLVLYFVMLRYAHEILTTTAKGNLYPPRVSMRILDHDLSPVFKQFLLFFLLGAGAVLVASLGAVLLFVYIPFVLVFIPAQLMVLISTESLFRALNPMVFVPLAWRIGPAYLLMYFFLILLGIAPGVLAQKVIVHLPWLLQPFLASAANYYYMFVSFHLIGYVLLQYHLEIGYDVNYEDFRAPEVSQGGERATEELAGSWSDERHAESLIQQGRYDEARDFLGRRFEQAREPSTELCRKYFRLLLMQGEGGRTRVGRHLIPGLLDREERREALRVFRHCREEDSAFLPDAESLFHIAEAHDEAGEHKQAVGLFRSLYRNYPGHGRAVEALFRIGYILNERLLAPEKARRLLEGILDRYPQSPLRERIESYLRHSVP
jgi:tetratricopeptide (TPR) repeat protein